VTGVRVEYHRGAACRAAARVAVRLEHAHEQPTSQIRPARPPASGGKPRVVGIVNITADSFSDGDRYLDLAAAVAHARKLRADLPRDFVCS
jgi:hypothetical protein